MIKYLIMNYHTEEVMYYGPSLWQAAVALVPGTTFGQGYGRMEALKQALPRAQNAREAFDARISFALVTK